MKRWALIVNNRCETIVEQASEPVLPGIWVETTVAGPGWYYENGEFTPGNPRGEDIEVTMRQARLALYQVGKLSLVEPAIESLPEPNKTLAKISWDSAGYVRRNDPTTLMLAQLLNLTEQELDELFQIARAIP